MHELLPAAERFAMLVNPANQRAAAALTADAQAAAAAIGRQIEIFTASTNREIDAAFASIVQKRADALLIGPSPCSSPVGRSSLRWRRATHCLRSILRASLSKPAG